MPVLDRRLLDPFDPASISPHAAIAIVGRRITGKSVLAGNLADATHRGNVLCAMWCADSDEHIWNTMPPGTAVASKLDMPLLRKCLKSARGCIIIDNCMYGREAMKELKELVDHPHIGSIVTYQFASNMIPQTTQYYFLLKDSVKKERDRLHHLCGHWISANLFRELFEEATVSYGALVVDVVTRRFWRYTAKLPETPAQPREQSREQLQAPTLEERVAVLESVYLTHHR